MSSVAPIKLPLDDTTENQLERGEQSMAKRTKRRLTNKWATLAALLIAVLWTLPTFGLFVSSLRPAALVNSTGWWTIFENWGFTLDNYAEVLKSGNGQLDLAGSFVNSLAITIPATVFPLVIASLAAYAFAWIDFKGKGFLFVAVFALQIVPLQMALVPLLSLFSRGLTINEVTIFPGLDMSDVDRSFATIWIAHVIFAIPLAVFLLHNFIAEIPHEVIEAARVDGAGHGRVSGTPAIYRPPRCP